MLDRIIAFSLHHRLQVLVVALALMVFGGWQIAELPIDVFPNLNRPRVIVVTEAHGMAPEEVETLITFPLETALNGASGVQTVRSSSSSGISVIYVEFDWGTDILTDRQIVNERLQLVSEQMPEGISPTLAPISSILGQILVYGVWSEGNKTPPMEVRTMADWVIRQRLLTIPGVAQVFTLGGGRKQYQVLVDPDSLREFGLSMHEVHLAVDESNSNATGGYVDQRGANEMLVRGIGRVTSLDDLRKVTLTVRDGRPVTLGDVARIVETAQVKRGDSAAYRRSEDGSIEGGPSVVLTINKQPDGNTRAIDDAISSALDELRVALPSDIRIAKVYSQRSFIDRAIENVIEAIADGSVLIVVVLFLFLMNFRTTFITLTAIPLSIVTTACVFALFGLSINTMTLGGLAVAIGELVDDAIVDVENIYRRLKEWRLKNEDRRLNTSKSAISNRQSAIKVVFDASVEVRSSVVYGTAIVVLVFLPLFALEGMEGKLFVPLATAYVVSLLASLLVSLSVTPALASLLLIGRRAWNVALPALAVGISALIVLWVLPRAADVLGMSVDLPGNPWWWVLAVSPVIWIAIAIFGLMREGDDEDDGTLLNVLRGLAGLTISFSTKMPSFVLAIAGAVVVVAMLALYTIDRDFLPPFNEGAIQVNAMLTPGTSLDTSNQIGEVIAKQLLDIDQVETLVRRTGRAETDEHAEGVHASEIVLGISDHADREATIEQVRNVMADIPGVVSSTEQPIAHLISHMLSGVKAQIGVKLYGDDLDTLRTKAKEMEAAIAGIPGLKDVFVEQQTNVPQLRIELDRDALMQYQLRPTTVMELVETAMNGKVVDQILDGQRTFDLLVRLDESFRADESKLRRLTIGLPDGGSIPLEAVADIYESRGPNSINREQVRRRIVLQANVAGRGIVEVANDVKERIAEIELPEGYFVQFGGQFESQASATRRLGIYSTAALVGMFLVLYTLFNNANFALQVLIALPTAFVGAVAALYLTNQTLTVAAIVGFISLCGIASRNGILLLNHYVYLVQHEGESWTREMISRAGQERLAPVLMTALTSGIGLLPLAMAAGESGKEVLYPVATVIVGGLITSTLAEFFVRPALFWTVGRGAGKAIVADRAGHSNDS